MAIVQNPVIRGFNPDPSVCRVGLDFYLVTSTFEFFPGIAIYHSRDMAHWTPIGHCLTLLDQLELNGCPPSGGLFAPTIRYHDELFYVTCTNVSGRGNFIVHSKDVRGPWSNPVWVDQGGIDPSLLFDGDYCFFTSSHEWEGTQCIIQCTVNPLTGEKLSPSRPVSFGSGGKYPEAPHLYKIGSWYYLMLAEGGTEYGHMVTIFRSRSPWGPFEGCPHNPILSHRGANAVSSPFQCVGHADFVEDASGLWWMVALGVRPLPNVLLHNLGRETFLARVEWREDNWPVVNSNGLLTETLEVDSAVAFVPMDHRDDFSDITFGPEYCFVRNPHTAKYRRGGGRMILSGGEKLDTVTGSPTFACVRQKEWKAHVAIWMDSSNDALAGLSAYYNGEHHYEIVLEKNGQKRIVALRKRLYDISIVEKSCIVEAGAIRLMIDASKEGYVFYYEQHGKQTELGFGAVAGLCTECTSRMTFTGVFFGPFCERGQASFWDFSVIY